MDATDHAADRFLSIPGMLMLKASMAPVEDAGHRYVYLEASNEARDVQGERVMAKALQDSAEYYSRYGNLDIQHRSIIGLANGDPDYALHEIGRPVEVKADGRSTFVKGEIFRGEGRVAESANMFWDSITKLKPAMRWYPSVAGKILDADEVFEKGIAGPVRRIKRVRWNNIGFSRTPVNVAVPTVSTVPFGVLAKCWGVDGIDMVKALEAGYGTDSAALAGGGALRTQSLDHKVQSYWDFRERMSADLLGKKVGQRASDMISHATAHYGLNAAESGEMTERFLADLKDGLNRRKS
jgi:hypothetical protein